MKAIAVSAALIVGVGALSAQGPQAPSVTPTKFAYYSGAEIQSLNTTVKGGGPIKFNRINRGDHEFQSFNFRPKSTAAPGAAQ